MRVQHTWGLAQIDDFVVVDFDERNKDSKHRVVVNVIMQIQNFLMLHTRKINASEQQDDSMHAAVIRGREQ